ncbi:hypothetical protein ANTRET_LOCUS9309 [Anthophora retusa]
MVFAGQIRFPCRFSRAPRIRHGGREIGRKCECSKSSHGSGPSRDELKRVGTDSRMVHGAAILNNLTIKFIVPKTSVRVETNIRDGEAVQVREDRNTWRPVLY